MTGRLVFTIALLFGPGMLECREIRHRIALKPGREETIVRGRIPTPQDTAVYVLRFHIGQHLSIRLDPGTTLRAYALVKPPVGEQIGPGAELDFDANQSGGFQLRIIPLEQTSGTFRLHLRTQ
jgi:hypothetical protein